MDITPIPPIPPQRGSHLETVRAELAHALGNFTNRLNDLTLGSLSDPKELQKTAALVVRLNQLTKPLAKEEL